jgi:hypothetical protein
MVPDPRGKAQPTYRSYLLRLWRADNAGQPVCRASLEEPGGHPQLNFESLAALCAYLAAQMGDEEAEQTV